MAHDNFYGDLIKITGGDVAVVDERVGQFRDFANTVPGSQSYDHGYKNASAPEPRPAQAPAPHDIKSGV